MNDMTPGPEERAAKLKGLGTSRKRVEDARFTQGKGHYVDDIKHAGHALRRLRALALCPCPRSSRSTPRRRRRCPA
jgi:hypothetical protein